MSETQDGQTRSHLREKDPKIVGSNPVSDVERISSERRNGSIWTIIGCAIANLSDGYQQNLVLSYKLYNLL